VQEAGAAKLGREAGAVDFLVVEEECEVV